MTQFGKPLRTGPSDDIKETNSTNALDLQSASLRIIELNQPLFRDLD